ncbi:MAG: hypothetical protein JKY83_11840 [Rhizobiaceae bacterium]|nr:hypothetical protein [Rhizobiaceae bacterium]
MHGITITYEFDGDEAEWESAVQDFINAINNDSEIAGKFTYQVHKAKEGNRRIHWGQWDVPETVQKMQANDYFKIFATKLKEMAGGTLVATPVSNFMKTN